MTTFETIFNNPSLPQTKSQRPGDRQKQDGCDLRLQGSVAKATFLINGDSYFAELARALRQARRTVWIVGWDFNPDIPMEPDKSDETLSDLLHELAAANPQIEIRILVWTLGPIYSDKSLRLLRKKSFPRNERIDLRFDLQRAVRGCHHQKLVCIDDTVSFIGGMDLTSRRWDTWLHRAKDKLRRDPEGVSYDPLHDVQAMVTGDAARLIGDIARRRWENATGENHLPLAEDVPFSWPDDLAVSMREIAVSFALTEPSTALRPGISDGIAMTLDVIARARRQLYIEAQYLASFRVADAIAARLQEEDGPEVVIICTRSSHGLIEKIVMGGNRDRVIRRLKRADRADRLRVYYAVVPGPIVPGPVTAKESEVEVLVHSKLIIADDELVRIGSSNLNNRSEEMDGECDMLVEAGNDAHRRAIVDLRNRLLSEYLGTTPESFAEAFMQSGSLIEAVDALNDGPRGLREFTAELSGSISPISGTAIFDPVRPFTVLNRLGLGALVRLLIRPA
ncbi:phospholipase D-like domain-containing protein [Rhizobium leguminosarum]|uniref:phospholipase D-like domain-containing protein n=1 Tax=Rhizobium leguminosarum TaxID=384 RepID=UPI001031A2FD|nr:phospholipase D-like domain-containing protein [Rhizobium leguminosarum]TAV84984.1 phospholipase [Rhizobium leguminosarum]TAV86299.1 phospholipase [Rhizobium leguminosarum]TAW27507.1 phospholipase [Rhizobium leguminosarum]TAX25552.1 phospholipase [Rhizobium leguminosarum]TAY29030.1 phospholipase [Rhizobium leguminosarum]